jgi:hypothetical protein
LQIFIQKDNLQRENIMVLNGALEHEELALVPVASDAAYEAEASCESEEGELPVYIFNNCSDIDDDIDDDYEDDDDDFDDDMDDDDDEDDDDDDDYDDYEDDDDDDGYEDDDWDEDE